MSKILLSPSILAADFANLGREIELVENAGADMLHVDVMDGHFVPNITMGPDIVKAMKRITKLPLDVHLMIANPEKYIGTFADAGADIITFHYEATTDHKAVIKQIKLHNCRAGISLMPKTSPEVLEKLYPELDLILVMTVEPGFCGQEFMSEQLGKISYIAQHKRNDTILQVDGGINNTTSKLAVNAGATALVAGSYIFKQADYKSAIASLR